MFKNKDQKIEALRAVPMFAACSRKELDRIASLADAEVIAPGRVLTKEGAPGREAFVIASGEAVATLRGKKLSKLGPGSIVGEMALLDNGPRSATVTAATEMSVLVLDPRSFWAMVEDVPSVARKVMQALATRLRAVEKAPTY